VTNPFTVLGVGEDAGDDEIRERYLALVRAFPPDRDPERFQACRTAFDAVRDQRGRLQVTLLTTGDAALSRLRRTVLEPPGTVSGRATRATVTALLLEGIDLAVTLATGSSKP